MPIEIIQQPMSDAPAGMFELPTGFDRKKYAAKWVLMGASVAKAQGREQLLGTRLSADGWSVYQEDRKPVKRTTEKSGEYILMFRSREEQDAVNAVYGNVGKERMIHQKKGQIKTSGGVDMSGQLSDEQLQRAIPNDRSMEEDGEVKMNPISVGSGQVEVAPLQTGGSN